MKQNERLLVYAVTGFLAVILVIAVWFGNDAKAAGGAGLNADGAASSKESVRGLGSILDQTDPNAVAKVDANQPLVPEVSAGAGEQPLNAGSKTMAAAELVAQMLGPSRRDYSVRYVMPRPGDSLETLVQRWCGSRDFLDKAKRINEDLTMVRVGTEVALPWVDDEALYEIHVARQVARVTPVAPEVFANRLPLEKDPSAAGDSPSASPAPATIGAADATTAVPASDGSSANRGFSDGTRISELLRINSTPRSGSGQPSPAGIQPEAAPKTTPSMTSPEVVPPGVTPAPASLAGATRYEVKSGDSWWRIADRTYGRKNADKMVKELKSANPGAGDVLKVGQVLILPPKS